MLAPVEVDSSEAAVRAEIDQMLLELCGSTEFVHKGAEDTKVNGKEQQAQ